MEKRSLKRDETVQIGWLIGDENFVSKTCWLLKISGQQCPLTRTDVRDIC